MVPDFTLRVGAGVTTERDEYVIGTAFLGRAVAAGFFRLFSPSAARTPFAADFAADFPTYCRITTYEDAPAIEESSGPAAQTNAHDRKPLRRNDLRQKCAACLTTS